MNIKCNGKNCNSTNGLLHSEECQAEHDKSVNGANLKGCFEAAIEMEEMEEAERLFKEYESYADMAKD